MPDGTFQANISTFDVPIAEKGERVDSPMASDEWRDLEIPWVVGTGRSWLKMKLFTWKKGKN